MSHDRYFLNRICNGILSFENDGSLYYSEGDYDYYIEKRKTRIKNDNVSIPKEKKEDTRVKIKNHKLTWKESKELETIERDIMSAEAEIDEIEKIFSSPDFHEKHATNTNSLKSKLAEAETRIRRLFERWEELEKIKNGIEE